MPHRIPLARLAAGLVLGLVTVGAAASPAAAARVRIDNARLDRIPGGAVANATIHWIRSPELRVGDVRLVAVSRRGSRPTLLASATYTSLPDGQEVAYAVPRARLRAIRRGNRVVLTASQHAYSPSPTARTRVTYVTVEQLQAGPHRGRIGRFDCSARPIEAQPRADLVGCDLVGAYLARARVSSDGLGTRLETADLTGADLREADLTRAGMAGARLNGANASGATIDRMSLAHAEGIGFTATKTILQGANLFDARLVRAHFERSRFTGDRTRGFTSLAHADLTRARLTGAELDQNDMAVSRLVGTDLRGATLRGPDLSFSNLTDANLRGAAITDQKATLQWALLCRTEMPTEGVVNRDCTG